MGKQLKNNLILVTVGVTLFVVLWHLDKIGLLFIGILRMLNPVLLGCLLAFVLNVPMVKVEKVLWKIWSRFGRKKEHPRFQTEALLITFLLVAGLIALLCVLIIPPMISSLSGAFKAIQTDAPKWKEELGRLGIPSQWLDQIIQIITDKIQGVAQGNGMGTVVSSVISPITSTLGNLVNFLMALIIAVYLLLGKKTFYRHCRMLGYAVLPAGTVRKAGKFWKTVCSTYNDFFSGQCVEAVILGILMFTAFTVAGMPYAGLVAVLTAASSFIPYVGSFASCAIGAFLIFLIDPMKAVISIVVYQIVQFCENQFIYPHVVGGAVGLPALWTLIAVIVGANVGGVVGMIFCIPLTSVFYTLIKEWLQKQLEEKADYEAQK